MLLSRIRGIVPLYNSPWMNVRRWEIEETHKKSFLSNFTSTKVAAAYTLHVADA